jgi:hypothetical protein
MPGLLAGISACFMLAGVIYSRIAPYILCSRASVQEPAAGLSPGILEIKR